MSLDPRIYDLPCLCTHTVGEHRVADKAGGRRPCREVSCQCRDFAVTTAPERPGRPPLDADHLFDLSSVPIAPGKTPKE